MSVSSFCHARRYISAWNELSRSDDTPNAQRREEYQMGLLIVDYPEDPGSDIQEKLFGLCGKTAELPEERGERLRGW
jgi:hypothetical protein